MSMTTAIPIGPRSGVTQGKKRVVLTNHSESILYLESVKRIYYNVNKHLGPTQEPQSLEKVVCE